MSLDDLRDHYKASRQSNDLQLKLNGATYRTPLRLARFGNTITLKSEGIYQGDLDELNNKYDLNFSKRFTYSLNKKKRWELTKDLTSEMPYFAKDDIDVRLYETRNRNQKKANCIAVHKSKGDPIGVKKTFANLASIKKAQDIEMIAKNTKIKTTVPEKNPHVPKKNRKCSKPGINQKKSNLYEEVIYVDADEDDDNEDTSYIQYEVEYAPKTDILKYGYQNEGIKNKATKAKKFANKDIFDEYEVEISEEEDENVDNASSTRPNTLVSAVDLDDLIDQQILKMVKENSLKEYKNQMRQEMTASNDTFIDKKDRKVYIDSGSDSDSANTNRKSTSSTVSKRKSAKPIAINLNVSNQGLDSQSLKDTYGLKYAEAHLCWPRMFSINLDEEIRSRLLKNHSTSKDFDIVMWLRFEQTNKPVEYGATEFKVSILTNLNCKSIALENVNPCEVSTVSKLVEKSLEFMLSLPVSMYHQKDFSKPWSYANKSDFVDSLPNIGGKKNVKTLEEIKLDLIQGSLEKFKTTQPSTSQPQPPPVNRSNSIEVKKHDEIIDEVSENKLKSQLSTIFEKHSYECILCFDEKPNLDDCVVIKSCAHCICQSCMRAFIDSHLFNSHLNAGNLQCPGCDTNLELALMINFASNANFMEIFIRHTIERVVFVLNDYKWCPSPYCGKIIQLDLNSNPYGTVSCTCGFKMCLRCNNAPHFPAKCSQVANYYKELNVNNDFYTPEDNECVSLGKRCPLCATYIEKNGGCNHMYCVTCQKYFCWNCLVDWDTHNKSGGSCKPVGFGKIRIEFKKERKATKTRKANQVRYEDSLNHRQKRTYQTKRELAKDAKRLICTLDEEKKTEAKKYLDSMIEFLNEMHFVCEHAYVLISDYSMKRESANHIRNLISSIEVNIWLIESTFKNGSGCAALDELKRLHEKSMRCIKIIKAIKTDE